MKSNLLNIIRNNGPISVSQFTKEALFNPIVGYYNTKNPFGKRGDFITSPEISQVFGEIIGAYLLDIWQNNYFGNKINLVEMGAGNGTLMKDFLNIAKNIPNFLEQCNLSIIEISSRLQNIQKKNLSSHRINWYSNFSDFYQQNNNHPIFFIANELFDCFAVDQFIKTENSWSEKLVTNFNGSLGFCLRDISPSTSNFIETAISTLDSKFSGNKIGDFFEYSQESLIFINQLAKAIKKTNGVAIIIDYGYIKNQFVNTLQAIKNHQFCNILTEVGNCDITSLVNFAWLDYIANQHNLKTSIISQANFLINLGIEARREKLKLNKDKETQKLIDSSINRLINKKSMGELFKVLIIW